MLDLGGPLIFPFQAISHYIFSSSEPDATKNLSTHIDPKSAISPHSIKHLNTCLSFINAKDLSIYLSASTCWSTWINRNSLISMLKCLPIEAYWWNEFVCELKHRFFIGFGSLATCKDKDLWTSQGCIKPQQTAVLDCRDVPAACCGFYFKGLEFSKQLDGTVDELQLIGEAMPFEVRDATNSWTTHL